MSWIDINKEQPQWYENVEVKVNGVVIENRHRLQGDNTVYYGSNETNEIIFEDEITHWRLLNNKNNE